MFFLPSKFNKQIFKDKNFCEFIPSEKHLGYTVGVQDNGCHCHSLYIGGHVKSFTKFVKDCEP